MIGQRLKLRLILCVGIGMVVLFASLRFELPFQINVQREPEQIVGKAPNSSVAQDNDDVVATIDAQVTAVRPQVAWLLSFPNSGTSYTILNIEKMSNMSTATNYGDRINPRLPIRPELTNGPFIHQISLGVPEVILTKTHCAGYCDECSYSRYVQTTESFERGCRTISKTEDGKFVEVQAAYDSSVPTRAVHLVRSPFNNLVARLHMGIKRRKVRLGWTEEQLGGLQRSKEGFEQWCKDMDQEADERGVVSMNLDPTVLDLWRQLPCRDEWYRYVQWHDLAVQMTGRYQNARAFPVLVLYYEDYTTDYNKTVQDLFDFLDIKAVRPPVTFNPSLTYPDYFDAATRRKAAEFVKALASPKCWSMLKRYFEATPDTKNSDLRL